MHFGRERSILAGMLVFIFVLRAFRADQPVVENYVGRQVPTAMVARNIERGSGFLHPQLDTAPFPNLFLVEPPVYAQAVVALRSATGLALEPAGRLVSALAIVLGAWGLYGLARSREGPIPALVAVAAFGLFPVTIRYGRAFQPDALMLGALIAGLRCWDEYESGRGWIWLAVAWPMLALTLALKVIAAYLFVPLFVSIVRPRRAWKLMLALSMLGPVLLWYAHTWFALSDGVGSKASADNRAIWMGVLSGTALVRAETLRNVVRFLVLRAFTPLGLALAIWGFRKRTEEDGLWFTWGGAVLAAMALLAAKLHHEYYWLALSPVVAVGIGKGLTGMVVRRHCWAAAGLAGCFVILSAVQTLSTWRTPAEWAGLADAAGAIRDHVPREAWVVAPEALLFEADRRGCRLEWSARSASRAAGEWGGALEADDPLALIEFYRRRGARFVADVAAEGDPARLALHDAVRRRYNVLVDRPGVLLAALPDPEDGSHGRR